MIPDFVKSIIWDIVYIILGYCLIYKIPRILGLKRPYDTITKIVGILIVVFSAFSIIKAVLQ